MVPFSRAVHGADLAAVGSGEDRCRQAGGAGLAAQVLEHRVRRIRIIGERGNADFVKEGLGLFRTAPVEVHRDHREIIAVAGLCQPVQRGHFLAAGGAPGGPEVQQDRLAGELRNADVLAVRSLEFQAPEVERLLRGQEGGDITPGKGLGRRGCCQRGLAAFPCACVATGAANHVYRRNG